MLFANEIMHEILLNVVSGIPAEIEVGNNTVDCNIFTHSNVIHKMAIPECESEYYQIRVYQQFVNNLCGYHATYNILMALKIIKNKQWIHFDKDAAEFWKYVAQFKRVLRKFRTDNHLNANIEPWRDEDIENGDFERSYLKVFLNCSQYFPILQSEPDLHINFQTVYFQYGQIVNNANERKELIENIKQFTTFVPDQQSSLINVYMLGITNHWISLIAIKFYQNTQFIIMDSRNHDYYHWKQEQIRQFVEQESEDRVKQGLQPYKPYQLEFYEQGMVDTQIVNKLMIHWLTGYSDIETYQNNQELMSFIKPLLLIMNMSLKEFAELQEYELTTINLKQNCELWAQMEKVTIFDYLKNPSKQIDTEMKLVMYQLSKLLNVVKQQSNNECLLQASNAIDGLIEYLTISSQIQSQVEQQLIYYDDAYRFIQSTQILDLKKVYKREYNKTNYDYLIRVQLHQNIFHPQGGGQPDDVGYLEHNGIQYPICGMYNDRQHLQVYLDLHHDEIGYAQLKTIFLNSSMITQNVNPKHRMLHARINTAALLVNFIIRKMKYGIQLKGCRLFSDTSYCEFTCPNVVDLLPYSLCLENILNQFIQNTTDNDAVMIRYVNENQFKQSNPVIPEFVFNLDRIRMIHICLDDVGYPSYGTVVKHINQIGYLYIDRIVMNGTLLRIYYHIMCDNN